MSSKIDRETNFMQCLACGRTGCKYVIRQRSIVYKDGSMVGVDKRKNFTAKCNKCGWVGKIKYSTGVL